MGQEQSQNSKDSEPSGSFVSSIIAEYVNPNKDLLPWPYGKQECNSKEAIVKTALGFLDANTLQGEKWHLPYQYCRPSLIKYAPHQWLWDDCAHMIVLSHFDTSRATRHLKTLLSMQRKDGRIPEIIYWGDQSFMEDVSTRSLYSENQFPDLTQMPLPPHALRAIYNKTNDKELLQELLPKVLKYYQWWKEVRAVDDDGLVVIIHPWESGLDASPLYDVAWGITEPKPSFMELYPNFWKTAVKYKFKFDWDQKKIVNDRKGKTFLFKDVGVNSVYASGWGILSNLANEIEDTQNRDLCKENQLQVEASILTKLWNEKENRFISLYRDKEGNEKESHSETVQSLFPLLLDSIPEDKRDSIVKNQLLNENKFWTNYPIPSTSQDNPSFESVFTNDRNLMWRGPSWGMTNWIVMQGLVKHHYDKEAGMLLEKWVSAYGKSGIYEMWDPLTGEAYGVEGLGMSTLIVDSLIEVGKESYPIVNENSKSSGFFVLAGARTYSSQPAVLTSQNID